MNRTEQEQPSGTEVNGFAWASVIIGSISLFYADRLFYPAPRHYVLLALVLPAAGIATALVAHRRVQQNPTTRGSELALAGGIVSLLSAVVLVLTEIFVN